MTTTKERKALKCKGWAVVDSLKPVLHGGMCCSDYPSAEVVRDAYFEYPGRAKIIPVLITEIVKEKK